MEVDWYCHALGKTATNINYHKGKYGSMFIIYLKCIFLSNIILQFHFIGQKGVFLIFYYLL